MMRFAIQVEQCGDANLTAKSGKGQHHHPGLGHWGDQRTSMAHKESRFGVLEATLDIEIIERKYRKSLKHAENKIPIGSMYGIYTNKTGVY